MTSSSDFWRAQLEGYKMERGLALPFDRHRLFDSERTGRALIAEFELSEHLTQSFLD
ncbi:unnamed protein product, partial [Rotaria sp. Silwood2]